MTDTTSSQSTAPTSRSTSSTSSTTTATTGLESWLVRRAEWTRVPDQLPDRPTNLPPNISVEQRDAWLDVVSQSNQLGIYRALVVDRRKLSTPLPLGFAIKIIVQGWKNDGTWPEGLEAPQDSDDGLL
ncbi:hypothetical protein J3Q64DRAFT_1835197 [Phycomyces blakesleeanus]|uniref:Gag1-like clamp domain-containing protein n=2 Tax=Phycomyces blakesleeanus TaxID=4837 RepID=A0A163DU05_PHYB8|nr:hypothetical protein PHYBLDRAFT_181524 [Phycomyces blakesleeanus NRRL 1555(-)]OAD73400.1 hypothetical protein PHYBLDRAFT_181524 [Phycomyces blakesleeanus NRRL 1555(-)]|eukprot:XP_018291440.1 hypothetical protein PHYBLDRAFT_181524 [Phycomyces blakesleeanus NRRL 1555(-)]